MSIFNSCQIVVEAVFTEVFVVRDFCGVPSQ